MEYRQVHINDRYRGAIFAPEIDLTNTERYRARLQGQRLFLYGYRDVVATAQWPRMDEEWVRTGGGMLISIHEPDLTNFVPLSETQTMQFAEALQWLAAEAGKMRESNVEALRRCQWATSRAS